MYYIYHASWSVVSIDFNFNNNLMYSVYRAKLEI